MTVGPFFDFCRSHWPDLGMLALCALATLALGVCVVAFGDRGRSSDHSWRLGEAGGLSEELVLVFPFFLLFLGITIQLVLLLNARLVVNYAAFAAGRSASVWIPATTTYEASNTIQLSDQAPAQTADATGLVSSPSGKLERIRGAAVLACAPVSPNYLSFISQLAPTAGSLVSGSISQAAQALNGIGSAPATLLSLIPRWFYSKQYTSVYFNDNPNASMMSFSANGDIKVTVQHDFYVGVPFVGRILGTPYINSLASGLTFGLLASNVYYIPIKESYVFHNEGERLAPGY